MSLTSLFKSICNLFTTPVPPPEQRASHTNHHTRFPARPLPVMSRHNHIYSMHAYEENLRKYWKVVRNGKVTVKDRLTEEQATKLLEQYRSNGEIRHTSTATGC